MRRSVKNTLLIIPVVMLVVAGIIVCVLQWRAWFGNQAEPQYEVPVVPHNIVVTFAQDATHSRIISWRADTILSDSHLELISDASLDTLYLPAQGQIVNSRSGKAAYYRVELLSLDSGEYSYRCCTADTASQWYRLSLRSANEQDSVQHFLVFDDIIDKIIDVAEALSDSALNISSADADTLCFTTIEPTGIIFAGNIIQRPTDRAWKTFFSRLQDKQASIPIIALPCNYEYLKGVIKTLDARWTHIFANPGNGPVRFIQSTYYIDFEHCRFIILDTEALNILSDYTVMQTWLNKVLSERDDVWKIVVMQHSAQSFSDGRNHPLTWLAFNWLLPKADLVISGDKLDNHCLYKNLKVSPTTLTITSINVENNQPLDSISINR